VASHRDGTGRQSGSHNYLRYSSWENRAVSRFSRNNVARCVSITRAETMCLWILVTTDGRRLNFAGVLAGARRCRSERRAQLGYFLEENDFGH
jgi:hypothetical protein